MVRDQIGHEDLDAGVALPFPYDMWHCTVCNVLVDATHAKAVIHCDTEQHRDRISRMIPGQETMVQPRSNLSSEEIFLRMEELVDYYELKNSQPPAPAAPANPTDQEVATHGQGSELNAYGSDAAIDLIRRGFFTQEDYDNAMAYCESQSLY